MNEFISTKNSFQPLTTAFDRAIELAARRPSPPRPIDVTLQIPLGIVDWRLPVSGDGRQV